MNDRAGTNPLIFKTHSGGIEIYFWKVNAEQVVIDEEPIMVPHHDPVLAKKGEVEPSGKIRIINRVRLFQENAPPIDLSPVASAEWLLFKQQRVQAETWQPSEPGKPDVIEVDAAGANA